MKEIRNKFLSYITLHIVIYTILQLFYRSAFDVISLISIADTTLIILLIDVVCFDFLSLQSKYRYFCYVICAVVVETLYMYYLGYLTRFEDYANYIIFYSIIFVIISAIEDHRLKKELKQYQDALYKYKEQNTYQNIKELFKPAFQNLGQEVTMYVTMFQKSEKPWSILRSAYYVSLQEDALQYVMFGGFHGEIETSTTRKIAWNHVESVILYVSNNNNIYSPPLLTHFEQDNNMLGFYNLAISLYMDVITKDGRTFHFRFDSPRDTMLKVTTFMRSHQIEFKDPEGFQQLFQEKDDLEMYEYLIDYLKKTKE